MKKAELIESIATSLGGSKSEATDALDAVLEAIVAGVKADGQTQIMGFGTFKISERAARMGRNPRTGEPIQIKASKSIRFTPAAPLKASL